MKTKTKVPKLSALIKSHKFDWVNPNITDTLFSAPEEIGTDFKLFHFDKYITSEDATKEMEKEGYRPANIYELLTWKDWNSKDWVVALGSVGEVDGDRGVPGLRRRVSGRRLYLVWWVVGWGSRCRFLAVRNSSVKNNIKKEKQSDLEIETQARICRVDEEMKALDNFKLTMFENTEYYDQIVVMKEMKAVAKCEHHHCEFTMIVHAGYIPTKWLIGASKFNRIVRKYAHLNKKTLQERVTQNILDELMGIKPKGAMVIVEGKHSCIAYRGVRDDSTMITSAVGGVFKTDSGAKAEFISLLKLHK